MVDIACTLGALLVGGISAAVFSGILAAQSFSYFKNYPDDVKGIKLLVGFVWSLDFWHTIFVTFALWDYLIAHFGNVERIDYIPCPLALTIAMTVILTFLVHMFFIFQIFKLSKKNYFMAIPLTIFACTRLCFGFLTTAKFITLRSLERFVQLYGWSFTAGLSLFCLLDILVTGLLCYLLFLNHKRSKFNGVLDKLVLYTFENGLITCAASVTSLVCWLASNTSLIFMGIHFILSKLYANFLLASLNRRNALQASHRSQNSYSGDRNLACMSPDGLGLSRKGSERGPSNPGIRIEVERTKISVSDTFAGGTVDRKHSMADTSASEVV